jgi:predicted metal-dependent HD superfamily phosphohydrolase
MLKDTFTNLTRTYTDDSKLTEGLWQTIESAYSETTRYYHNLSHLEHLIGQLTELKHLIKDWDSVLFAVFFHDIVYQATSAKNEENSAKLARKHLSDMHVSSDSINKVCSMILATKGHASTGDSDTDIFLDADLCILGHSWDVYVKYATQIRQEYARFPDFLYYPGRRKVIVHFLEMNRIFKTEYFFNKYEDCARENLLREMNA